MRDEFQGYFQRLFERVNSAAKVPFRQIPFDGWGPKANDCHNNVDFWVQHHPETKALRGWLFWGANEAGQPDISCEILKHTGNTGKSGRPSRNLTYWAGQCMLLTSSGGRNIERNQDSRTIQKVGFATGSSYSTIIFDGDDTLWRTMPLYAAAKHRFFALLGSLGLDAKRVEEEFEARDIKNVSAWGFTVERFRRSMVETYEAFARKQGKSPTLRVEQRISQIATSIVRNKTRPMPRAKEVLLTLRGRCRLILLTKGEYALQERRVAESGLSDVFERAVIVEHKERDTFVRLVRELDAAPERTWSVGDSLRSDIKPALEAGLNAVWIPQETWGYESAEMIGKQRVLQARTIRELPQILRKAGAIR